MKIFLIITFPYKQYQTSILIDSEDLFAKSNIDSFHS